MPINLSILERLIGIGEESKTLGVSIPTLRRWKATGELSAIHTAGGHRRYDLAKLKPELFRAALQANRSAITCVRVSSHDQKDDLERQKQVLELYCARQGWTFELLPGLVTKHPRSGGASVCAKIQIGHEPSQERLARAVGCHH